MTGDHSHPTPRARGFTLIELLVVIGIIAVVSAVSLPNIIGYVRSSRIRSAQDEVFTAIQRARAKAITTNSQYGVAFVIESPQVYWVHAEDPQPPAAGKALQVGRQPLNSASPNLEISTRYQLNDSVRFAVAANSCPTNTAAGNQASLRFDRYGQRTFPGYATPVPTPTPLQAVVGPTVNGIVVTSATAEASVCLIDTRNGFTRRVTIAAGGRVRKTN